MLNILTEVISPIEPGVWEVIQANYVLVAGAITSAVVGLGGTLLTIKGGLKGIGGVLGKKQEDGDGIKAKAMAKFESTKTLAIRKGQLEVNKKTCETNIINWTIKLDLINKPESRELIENQIAQEKAELAAHIKELEEVDKQLPSFSKFLA